MEAQNLYNNNSLFNNSMEFYNTTQHPVTTIGYSTDNSSNSMFNPSAGYGGIFFVAATALFMIACVYMITFLVILRFGTFVPIYDARFFRGRIYLCYGQRPCFGLFGTCNWCFVPLCMYFLLNPVREDENFSRAQEGGGLSREERREALQELLKPMVHVVCRSEWASRTMSHPSTDVEENGNTTAKFDGDSHVENKILLGKEDATTTYVSTIADNSKLLVSSTTVHEEMGTTEHQEETILEPVTDFNVPIFIDNSSPIQPNQVALVKIADDSLNSYTASVPTTNNDSAARIQQEDNADSVVSSSVHSLDSDPDPVCSICLSEYENGSVCIQTNTCNHRFHRDCLLEWLEVQNNTKCPCCRKDIITNQQVKETSRMLRKTSRRNFSKLWSYLDRKGRRDGANVPDGGFIREELTRTRTSETTEDLNVASGIVNSEIHMDQITLANEDGEDIPTMNSPVSDTMTRDLESGHVISQEEHRVE